MYARGSMEWQAEQEKLKDLLSETDASVEAVAEACAAVRRTLAGLLRQVGR